MTSEGRTPSRWRLLIRDLFRSRCWEHTAIVGRSYGVPEYADGKPSRWPWVSRFVWKSNLYPWVGGDEWCRWTVVLPLGFAGLVVPLWGCRDPECESCVQDCRPIAQVSTPASTSVAEDASRSAGETP